MQKILLPKETVRGNLRCQKARVLPTTNEVESDTDISLKELPLAKVVRM